MPRASYRLVIHLVLLSAVVLPVHSRSVKRQDVLTIDPVDPPPTQCEPFTFRWTGGTSPFTLILSEQGGNSQRHLGPTNDSALTWDTDFPAGISIIPTVIDANSDRADATAAVVQPGPNDICLGLPRQPPGSSSLVASSTGSVLVSPSPFVSIGSSMSVPSSLDVSSIPSTVLSTEPPTSSLSSSHSLTTDSSPQQGPAPKGYSSISASVMTTRPVDTTSFLVSVIPSSTPSSTVSTSPPSNTRFHLSNGDAVGIAVGVGCLTLCVAMVWFGHVRRRRSHTTAPLAHPSTAVHHKPPYTVDHVCGSQNESVSRAVRLSSDEPGNGDQSVLGDVYGDVNTKPKNSLAACAFLVNPCSPEYAACLSNRAYPEAAEGFLLSDKRLLELRGLNGDGAPPTRDRPSGGIQQMEMDTAVAEEGVSSERGVENNRGLRYETDGGVRLAGGRVGEVATEECDSMSEGSTLPPPYSSDFGDS